MLLTQVTDSARDAGAPSVSGAICVLLRSSAANDSVAMPGQARAAARFARSNSFMNATSDSIAARGQAL